jgi:hypothetical protein
MTTQFEINKVGLAETPLKETTASQGVARLLSPVEEDGYYKRESGGLTPNDVGIEDCSDPNDQVVDGISYNPLFAAAHHSFNDHRPLVLSPDMIWLAIAQGTANHINNNAETMRSKFVKHQGKAEIIVRRDDFVKGSFCNPWPEAFGAFSMAIMEHIGSDNHQKFVAEFSTTGPAEIAANDIVLMDSVKSYFKYVLMTRCGIPSVILEGTTDDWKLLQEKVEALSEIIPSWWMTKLNPICQGFIAASQGNADPGHWRNIYKWGTHSGSDYNDGWLTHLLPYIRESYGGDGSACVQNKFKTGGWGGGIETSAIPGGLSSVPFIWDYYNTKYEMSLMAGFSGVTQNQETLAIRPKIGWVVRDNAKALPEPTPRNNRW